MNTFGFPEAAWQSAKREAKAALVARARVRGMLPYSDLVRSIHSISLEPHDVRLFHLLGELSTEEAEAGRGMITALVVHKSGDMQPGPGFFEMAERLGHDASDILAFWIGQVKKVHAYWKKNHDAV
jgi:molybdopterin synthase catalytic subunit